MPLSSTLTMTLNRVILEIPPVIKDVQARKDYGKDQSLQTFTADLSGYKLLLQTLLDNPKPTQKDLDTAAGSTTDKVLPDVNGLTNNNIKLMNMGQLSTDRTIMPSVAEAENALLAVLHDNCQLLASRLKAEDLSAAPAKPIAGTMANLEAELKQLKVA